jgi:hypothetical protein
MLFIPQQSFLCDCGLALNFLEILNISFKKKLIENLDILAGF